jgi:hypothetical protein
VSRALLRIECSRAEFGPSRRVSAVARHHGPRTEPRSAHGAKVLARSPRSSRGAQGPHAERVASRGDSSLARSRSPRTKPGCSRRAKWSSRGAGGLALSQYAHMPASSPLAEREASRAVAPDPLRSRSAVTATRPVRNQALPTACHSRAQGSARNSRPHYAIHALQLH